MKQTNEVDYTVRFFLKNEQPEDYITDLKLEFELQDFCGTVPAVGDFVVHPGVPPELDRREMSNRQVFEVVARYFLPRAHWPEACFVALVVKTRPAEEVEAAIIV